MAEMTRKERVRAALEGRPLDRVPVSLWGHDFEREWRPRDLVAATLESYRAYGWDFIKFNPRATYFAEAWGNEYEPVSGRQPLLLARRLGPPSSCPKYTRSTEGLGSSPIISTPFACCWTRWSRRSTSCTRSSRRSPLAVARAAWQPNPDPSPFYTGDALPLQTDDHGFKDTVSANSGVAHASGHGSICRPV